MKNLSVEIKTLKEKARQLLRLGEENGSVYVDDFSLLNKEVHEGIDLLYRQLHNQKCNSAEEEASLCVAVLMGYNSCMYANPADERKKKIIFKRACNLLPKLSSSLLKCELLTYCYCEFNEENWAQEAYAILQQQQNLTPVKEEKEIREILRFAQKPTNSVHKTAKE